MPHEMPHEKPPTPEREHRPRRATSHLRRFALGGALVAVAVAVGGLSLRPRSEKKPVELVPPSATKVTSAPTPAPLAVPGPPRRRILASISRNRSAIGSGTGSGVWVPSTDFADKVISRFVLGYGRGIRVCANLAAPVERVPSSWPELEADAYAQPSPDGPSDNRFVESALIPLATAVEIPSVGQLVETVQAANTSRDAGLINGDDYRAAISLAAADAISHRGELNERAQHAYHLFALSRAAMMVPILANSADALTVCAHEQYLATSSAPPVNSEPASPSRTRNDIEEDKATLLRLLASAGLSPEQVGFDPNLRNDVVISVSAGRVSIAVPWMRKQFGSDFSVEARNLPGEPRNDIISGTTTGVGASAEKSGDRSP